VVDNGARGHRERPTAVLARSRNGHDKAPLCRASLARWGAGQRNPLVGRLIRPAQAPLNVSPILPFGRES
jgi:hypothetical protein